MTSFIPQYAKSTDPEVIATIEANKARIADFEVAARAFQERHGDDSADDRIFVWGHGDSRGLSGVLSREEPADGRWKVGRRTGVWEPFKNNPLREEFEKIRCKGVIPKGLDEHYLTGYDRSGAMIMHTPTTFVHEGVAYMGLGGAPLADQSASFGDGKFDTEVWTEMLGSEFMAALEAYNAAKRAEVEGR